MDPRLLDQHLKTSLGHLRTALNSNPPRITDILRAIKDIQAARRELWQDKPELEGAKP